jgi:hypothetical protein
VLLSTLLVSCAGIASTKVVRFGLAPVAGLNQWPVAVAGFLLGCVIPVFLLAIFWCFCAWVLVVGTVHLEVCYLVSGGDKGFSVRKLPT